MINTLAYRTVTALKSFIVPASVIPAKPFIERSETKTNCQVSERKKKGERKKKKVLKS
jgi:hypothetical protein